MVKQRSTCIIQYTATSCGTRRHNAVRQWSRQLRCVNRPRHLAGFTLGTLVRRNGSTSRACPSSSLTFLDRETGGACDAGCPDADTIERNVSHTHIHA